MKLNKIIQGSFKNNVFLLVKGEESILIDPGFEKEPIEELLNSSTSKLIGILITHGHLDHIASAKYFQDKYNVDIYMSKNDQFLLDDPYKPLFIPNNAYGKIQTNFKYINTEEGTLKLGLFNIKVLATPGHTPGSLCFWIPIINTVFTGDTLFAGSIGRTDFEKGSLVIIEKSIKNKLYTLDKNILVWPGHGDCTTINAEAKNNPYVQKEKN